MRVLGVAFGYVCQFILDPNEVFSQRSWHKEKAALSSRLRILPPEPPQPLADGPGSGVTPNLYVIIPQPRGSV